MKAGEMLFRAAQLLKGLRYGTATAVSGTTLTDASLGEPAGFFDGGTLFFIGGTFDGQTRVINTYSGTSFSWSTAIAITSSQKYAALDNRYTREDILQALNLALQQLGPFDQVDTSIACVTGQESYDVALYPVIKEVRLGSVADGWSSPVNDWRVIDDQLYIDGVTGQNLRLVYEQPHPWLVNDLDEVTTAVHPMRLAWEVAFLAAMERSGRAENSEPNTKELLQLANQMRIEMRRFPIRRIERHHRLNELPKGES